MPKRLAAIFIGVDVLANSLLGGEPYQTLSCRIGPSKSVGNGYEFHETGLG